MCENEQANLMQCSPGTLWDQDLHICNWESVVDTSKCNIWACMVDKDTYPALYCNEVSNQLKLIMISSVTEVREETSQKMIYFPTSYVFYPLFRDSFLL